jgi:site-specific DNA-methyltransferase (adenine-specific)
MSSKSDEWTTPKWLFDWLDSKFCFTLDAAATRENALCKKYFTIADNGLEKEWVRERVWLNCPYSQIGAWMNKCAYEVRNGCPLVCALVPARTDTKWWHAAVMQADHVHFIKGRLKFGDGTGSAPFPSALVFWFGLKGIA